MMFEKIETEIPGCFVIKPRVLADSRGMFVKLFHDAMFEGMGLETHFKEEYFSLSSKGVVRGLHFQLPPEDHLKCITCLQGALFDVVVDLRKRSPTFGKHFSITIEAETPTMLYIPRGMAHGFMALADNTLFLNKTTTVYNAECDTGIKWDSCGIQWPGLAPIVSEKDENMVAFSDFKSPF
jgi:dTDP-4-dehydrorhamnose 3,5-epimerase